MAYVYIGDIQRVGKCEYVKTCCSWKHNIACFGLIDGHCQLTCGVIRQTHRSLFKEITDETFDVIKNASWEQIENMRV